ncbi:hypothetical protein ACWGBH_17650 [Streptomyces massasporeus]
MSGIGPVEPANSTDQEHSWDVIGADVPGPGDRLVRRRLGRAEPLNSPGKAGRFRFAVTVERGPAVTLRVVGTSYPGLTARAVPGPAVTAPAGTPRGTTAKITVSDCPALPPPEVDQHFST